MICADEDVVRITCVLLIFCNSIYLLLYLNEIFYFDLNSFNYIADASITVTNIAGLTHLQVSWVNRFTISYLLFLTDESVIED